jgi:hypothetical protein
LSSLVEILSRPAPEAIRGFMRRWHGLEPAGGEPPAGARMPKALAEFHRAYGTAADAWAVNRMLAPDELGSDDGHVVFYVEEQAVYLWAVAEADLDADDPPVLCRENEPGAAWVQDAPSVSVFLVQMLVMSAALNGPHAAVAGWLSTEEAERALAGLTRLDLPPWHWPGHPARWYAGEDAVAFVSPNPAPEPQEEQAVSVWVSATSDDALRFLEPHLSAAWEYYSPHDG